VTLLEEVRQEMLDAKARALKAEAENEEVKRSLSFYMGENLKLTRMLQSSLAENERLRGLLYEKETDPPRRGG
jgi:hypothetical protein